VYVRIVKQLIVESAVFVWIKRDLGDQSILKSVVFRDSVNLLLCMHISDEKIT